MSVAKIIEISATSTTGFDDAIRKGIAQASKSVNNISGAWVKEQKCVVADGKITEFRVLLKITFVLGS